MSELLVDGFFPRCQPTDRPRRQRVSGFREMGLPFESDTAITRHLAAFLQAHGDGRCGRRGPRTCSSTAACSRPTCCGERLLDVMGEWFGGPAAPRLLEGEHDLDHAVARGAAYYGWAKQRGGMRIRGGTARAYYVGIETAGLAVPGAPRPLRALCVVPIGMEEGTETDVPSDEIGLVVGEPAHFRFFSSSVRKDDRPGDAAGRVDAGRAFGDRFAGSRPAARRIGGRAYVPVRFHARLTELGVLELWCVSTTSEKRWKLEFSVREETT